MRLIESVVNRRRHERFNLAPGYTAITVRLAGDEVFTLEGYAYDISESGVRFEVDRPLEAGTRVSIQIDLPQGVIGCADDIGPGRSVFVTGNVVWCDVDDDVRTIAAVAITRYDRAGDKERLMRRLASGRALRAA
ncbi:MAG: PilZ domain-containing protein [Planctomycetota bacterium]